MISSQPSSKLWKNQRVIDSNGLVEPQDRERLFQNAECCNLLEDILYTYQQNQLLPSHYMHYSMNSAPENETITFRVYVNYRCTKKDRKEGKQRVVGEFFILYRIMRLTPQKVHCDYPFLILFDAKGGQVKCSDCGQLHIHRITQSSFYLIRTQFVTEMVKKLQFMRKYEAYQFTPHNFQWQKNNGETVFEHVKDHNYEPSYYFQRCEKVLADSLKLLMIKRGMDCQAMRFDEMFGQEESKPAMYKHYALFKLKYMCRKCEGKEIWTTRDKVTISFNVFLLRDFQQELMDKCVELKREDFYDESHLCEKYSQMRAKISSNSQQNIEDSNPEDKPFIQTLFKTEQRRLDRSIKREIDDHEEFQADFKEIGRWHKDFSQYKYPYLVLFSIKVPKMACQRCKKEKDGLIYITNLIDQAHSVLNRKVMRLIMLTHKKNQKMGKQKEKYGQKEKEAEVGQEKEVKVGKEDKEAEEVKEK